MKYSFCVATSMETKPQRTLQHVLYVRGSLSPLSPSQALFSSSAKPVLSTAFLQLSALFYLSVCFLSFFLPLFFHLSLSLPWHSLDCQACNRAAIV